MSARDDFGSGARSPGGWGGQGNMRTAAGGGGHGSLGGGYGSNASGMGGMVNRGAGFGSNIGPMSAGGGLTGTRNDRGTAMQQIMSMFGSLGGAPGGMGAAQFPGGFVPNVFRQPIPGVVQPPPADEVPPGMTLAEYYASLEGTGPYIQKRTRPMAPNVYGQPPAPAPGDRPPPPIYGPRSNVWTANNMQNPPTSGAIPRGTTTGAGAGFGFRNGTGW